MAALACGRPFSCGELESPETQITKALALQKQAQVEELRGLISSGSGVLSAVRFAEVVASLDGDRATVVAMVEAEGHVAWSDESAALSYVGREKFHMKPCPGAGWCAEADEFSRLREVLDVLLGRADAFRRREAAAYAPLVSDRYRDQGLDKAGLLARLAREFGSGPPLNERILGWQIRVDRELAEVGEDYSLRVAGGEVKSLRARYRLAAEGGRWRVVAGL